MAFTFDEIKKKFALEVEQAANRTLSSADELPLSYEEITPAWLTSVLAPALGVAGAQVVAHRLGEKDEGTSSRRRILLR
ncbi:hypothetical protein MXD62_27440 [Frankia sp. Mgl5]|uniref:hypothetical protein n=1 Tax=Frankia sp. Mgl5 TaxID=2933793 RepID=UPI00200CE7BD|nr:hypothetical protein [Frankia sp. Mgl5]MCK9930830.1 hypothetical protein [Frankia sp. Mgl5]